MMKGAQLPQEEVYLITLRRGNTSFKGFGVCVVDLEFTELFPLRFADKSVDECDP